MSHKPKCLAVLAPVPRELSYELMFLIRRLLHERIYSRPAASTETPLLARPQVHFKFRLSPGACSQEDSAQIDLFYLLVPLDDLLAENRIVLFVLGRVIRLILFQDGS